MDYQNGKNYKILNTVDDDCSVGSTTQPLSKRMAKHREVRNSQAKKDRLLYTKIRLLGVDDFYIELVEDYPCENLEQLRKHEGYYIREFGTLNHIIAGRTKHEWTAGNIDYKKEMYRKYHLENREERLLKIKEYRTNNKEKIEERKRQYYQEHKEEVVQPCKDR